MSITERDNQALGNIAPIQMEGVIVYGVNSEHQQLGDLNDEFLQLRTAFVNDAGWFDKEVDVDTDIYDVSGHTRYIVYRGESVRRDDGVVTEKPLVRAGFRMTQHGSPIDESLSFQMWVGKLDDENFQNQINSASSALRQINDEAARGNVWDLTRFVADLKLGGHKPSIDELVKTSEIYLELFGAALNVTIAESENHDPVWVFTASQDVIDFLDFNGIEYETIATGEISQGDGYQSSLCYLRARDSAAKLHLNNPDGARSLDKGLAEALLI